MMFHFRQYNGVVFGEVGPTPCVRNQVDGLCCAACEDGTFSVEPCLEPGTAALLRRLRLDPLVIFQLALIHAERARYDSRDDTGRV